MLLYLYTIEYQIHYIISPFNPLADIIPHDSTYIRNFQPLQGMMKNDRRNLGIGHRKNSFLHSGFQNSLYQFRLTDIEALPDLLHPPDITEKISFQCPVTKHQRLDSIQSSRLPASLSQPHPEASCIVGPARTRLLPDKSRSYF